MPGDNSIMGKMSDVDSAASNSCTRAGAFALLVSAVLIALTSYWMEHDKLAALGEYASLRLNLEISLEQLDEHPRWKQYKSSHQDAEAMPLGALLTSHVLASGSLQPPALIASPRSSTTAPSHPNQDKNALPPAPKVAAPTMLTVEFHPDELDIICSYILQLNDSEMLKKARQSSGYYDYSIYKWDLKRIALIGEASPEWKTRPADIPLEYMKLPTDITPEVPYQDVLSLTISRLRELVNYEKPRLTDTSVLGGVRDTQVIVSPGTLPRDLYTASVVADLILVFSLAYFAAFTGEAVRSSSFPADGTLFGAFSRSADILVVFVLALLTPLVGSVGVALASRRPVLIVSVAFVAGILYRICYSLDRKSYFEPITRRLRTRGEPKAPPHEIGPLVDPRPVEESVRPARG